MPFILCVFFALAKNKKNNPPFPGPSPAVPSSNDLVKAQKALEKKGSRARRKALDVFLSAMDSDPSTVKYATKGLWECLYDSNVGVLKGACTLISKGTAKYPNMFIPYVEPLFHIIDDASTDVFNKVSKVLSVIGTGSDKGAKEIITRSMKIRRKGMDWEERLYKDCQVQTRINFLLAMLGKQNPRFTAACVGVIIKTLKYPIYRPEISNRAVESLYKITAQKLLAICTEHPQMIRKQVPVILKVIGDALTFEKWVREKGDHDSMYSVFNNVFRKMTAIEPGYAVLPMVKNLSSTNKNIAITARKRLEELGRDPHKIVPYLLNCFANKSSVVGKNTNAILSDIMPLKPGVNANILLRYLHTCKNEAVLIHTVEALGKLVEKTDVGIGKGINVLIKLSSHPNVNVCRIVMTTLSKIALKEKKALSVCTKHLIKGLHHREPAVRLTALSSLENLVKKYEQARITVIPHLISARSDGEDTIRWRSSNILKELGVESNDIQDYLAVKNNLKETKRIMKELKRGSVINLSEVKRNLERAYENLKRRNYKKASIYANLARGGVLEIRAKSSPKIEVEIIAERGLFANDQNKFELSMTNIGKQHAYNISVTFSEDVEVMGSIPHRINAGDTRTVSLGWTPQKEGRQLFKVTFSFTDYTDYRRSYDKKIWLDVVHRPKRTETRGPTYAPEHGPTYTPEHVPAGPRRYKPIEAEAAQTLDTSSIVEAEDLYGEALRTALADNVLTDDEMQLLEVLRENLDIPQYRHEEMAKMIRAEKTEEMKVTEPDEGDPDRMTRGDDVGTRVEGQLMEGVVNFRSGSTRMDATSEILIKKFVMKLKQAPGIGIEISGHTDNRFGSIDDERVRKAKNKKLSYDRAKVVRDFLVDRGIPIERMVVKGYGEELPTGDNNTSEGRRMNQRVEIRFLIRR